MRRTAEPQQGWASFRSANGGRGQVGGFPQSTSTQITLCAYARLRKACIGNGHNETSLGQSDAPRSVSFQSVYGGADGQGTL